MVEMIRFLVYFCLLVLHWLICIMLSLILTWHSSCQWHSTIAWKINNFYIYISIFTLLVQKTERKMLLLQCWLKGAGNLIILIYKNPKISLIVLRSSYSPVTYMTEYSIFYAFWHVSYHFIYFHSGDLYRITKSIWIWK